MPVPRRLTTTVSTKGQIILPKPVRDRLHWGAGTRLVVVDTLDGVLLKAEPMFAPSRPEDVFGSLHYAGEPKTLEEMEAGIIAEAKRRRGRGRH